MGNKRRELFISKSVAKHGEKYDYSLVEYTDNKTPVHIICPAHGVFSQIPSQHTRGSGCPTCGVESRAHIRRMSDKEFLEKANAAHRNFYKYEDLSFKNQASKIEILCPNHGVFVQSIGSHLSGCGCPKCANEKTSKRNEKTQEGFIAELEQKCSDNLIYKDTIYKGWYSKVRLVCTIHGDFEITPRQILNTGECPICRKEQQQKVARKSQELFIRQSVEVHGDKYSYDQVEYVNSSTKVCIFCKNCEDTFLQIPPSHLSGNGCPRCAGFGFDPHSPTTMYLLLNDSAAGCFVGYGITKDKVTRFKKHKTNLKKSGFAIAQQLTWEFPTGTSALSLENALKSQYPKASMLGKTIEGFIRESTDAPFEQVKDFIENTLKENPTWQHSTYRKQ